MILRRVALLSIVGFSLITSEAFIIKNQPSAPVSSSPSRRRPQQQQKRQRPPILLRSAFFDDFEEVESNKNSNDHNHNSSSSSSDGNAKDSDIYAALKARQASLQKSEKSHNKSDGNSNGATSYKQNTLEDPFLVSWLEASTVPAVRIALDDWIRRMAIHTYPLAVCGSASGHLYLIDLQHGEELDCLLQLHSSQCKPEQQQQQQESTINGKNCDNCCNCNEMDRQALQHLYGRFDGGGVIAIAMKDDLVASAGREGGVHICTLVGQEQRVSKGSRGGVTRHAKLKLQRQGKIRGLELNRQKQQQQQQQQQQAPTARRRQSRNVGPSSLVTSLAFDEEGTLWVGGYDGILRGYDSEELDADNRPLMLRQKHALYELDLEDPILSISVNDEIGCGVAVTVHEGIVLFSLEDGEVIGGWNPFVSSARDEYARSAMIFQSDPDGVWSVVIGGSRGSLFQRQLSVDRFGTVSTDHPFRDQIDEATFPLKMLPAHSGAVLDMDSPLPGILVTGSQDGTMRVWDCSPDDEEEDVDGVNSKDEEEANYDDVQLNDSRPRCLYSLSGYKVWLGSVYSSPRKLVSDGADNSIIVHSFDVEEEDILFKEDDDDDFEGFNFEL